MLRKDVHGNVKSFQLTPAISTPFARSSRVTSFLDVSSILCSASASLFFTAGKCISRAPIPCTVKAKFLTTPYKVPYLPQLILIQPPGSFAISGTQQLTPATSLGTCCPSAWKPIPQIASYMATSLLPFRF